MLKYVIKFLTKFSSSTLVYCRIHVIVDAQIKDVNDYDT